MGVARDRVSKMGSKWVQNGFQREKLGYKIFFGQIFLTPFDTTRVHFENPEFQNFKMWAWPYNGQFVLNIFEKLQLSLGHLARLQSFYIKFQVESC